MRETHECICWTFSVNHFLVVWLPEASSYSKECVPVKYCRTTENIIPVKLFSSMRMCVGKYPNKKQN